MRRAQAALDELWPYTGELFEIDAIERALIEAGLAVELRVVAAGLGSTLSTDVLAQATLTRPRDGWMQSGGRAGRHSEHLGFILADMQFLQRAYPGAMW